MDPIFRKRYSSWREKHFLKFNALAMADLHPISKERLKSFVVLRYIDELKDGRFKLKSSMAVPIAMLPEPMKLQILGLFEAEDTKDFIVAVIHCVTQFSNKKCETLSNLYIQEDMSIVDMQQDSDTFRVPVVRENLILKINLNFL
jgi:hypothetical protein